MADWRQLSLDAILADGVIDTTEVKILKKHLYADGKIILADQDGTLALCKVSPEKFEVLSKAPVLESIAWTPPTLVGTRLYVRDRKTIEAFDLAR